MKKSLILIMAAVMVFASSAAGAYQLNPILGKSTDNISLANFSQQGWGEAYDVNDTIDGDLTNTPYFDSFNDIGATTGYIQLNFNDTYNVTHVMLWGASDGSGGDTWNHNISVYVNNTKIYEYYYDGAAAVEASFNTSENVTATLGTWARFAIHDFEDPVGHASWWLDELGVYGVSYTAPPVDSTPPVVTINAPVNNTNTTNRTQTINITCYDETQVSNITFSVNGSINQTNTTPVNNTAWIFELNFTTYNYYDLEANCSDGINTAVSGLFYINITAPASTPTVNYTNCSCNCSEVIAYLERESMNIYDIFFILQFIFLLLLIGYKTYNVVYVGKKASIQLVLLSFVSFFITWLVGLIVLLLDRELVYSVLFRLESWLIVPFVMLFIIELFFIIRDRAISPIQKQNSRLDTYKYL